MLISVRMFNFFHMICSPATPHSAMYMHERLIGTFDVAAMHVRRRFDVNSASPTLTPDGVVDFSPLYVTSSHTFIYTPHTLTECVERVG